MAKRQSDATMLTVLLLLVAATQALAGQECFRKVSFEEILEKVQLPSCLAKEASSDCSVLQHLRGLAAERGANLSELLERVTVTVFAHSDFTKELTKPGNPGLEVNAATAQHLAFFGVTRCLKGDKFCPSLRQSCSADTGDLVFLISGRCSKAIRCVPIASSFTEGKATDLLHNLEYLKFRMLERQLFIARDLGEVQLGVSGSSEFLIQSEINDTHSDSLLNQGRPMVLFTPWQTTHMGYYHLFNIFLEAALRLKHLFTFHVITVELSDIPEEKDRPTYRKTLESHNANVALYTKEHCSSSPTWAFTCQPNVATADNLPTPEQVSGFLLHEMLKQHSLEAPFPALSSSSKFLKNFIQQAGTYVIGVVPLEEMLTDTLTDWENLSSLVTFLTASFSVTYYPLLLTSDVAIELLKDENTGLNLKESLEGPCFLIRLPLDAGFTILRIDQPIMTLEPVVQSVSDKMHNLRMAVQVSQEYLSGAEESTLPNKLANTGHFAGREGVYDSSGEIKELVQDNLIPGRVDAFVEQMKFNEVYNVSQILVVETNPELMSGFFEKVGRGKPWLVAFVVTWSPLCKAARAILTAIDRCVKDIGAHDIQLVKVDCFEANEICKKLNIQAYPTIAMFKEGEIVANYSGPISVGSLCQFANLALEDPVIVAESDDEVQRVTRSFLPLKSRAFILRSDELPEKVRQVAVENHPYELFIYRRESGAHARLTAEYRDIYPESRAFQGSLQSPTELRDFVRNGHLDHVFPCTHSYLPQALARNKSLIILFHLDDSDKNIPLLQHVRSQFAKQASVCHMQLKNVAFLGALVQKIAGMSMPTLVAIARTGQKKTIHRLPLGPIDSERLQSAAADWVDRALGGRLDGGRTVEPLPKWQPATTVYNFVDEVYHGKAAKLHPNASSRLFVGRASAESKMEEPPAPDSLQRELPTPTTEDAVQVHEEL